MLKNIFICVHLHSFYSAFTKIMPYYAVRIGRNPGVYATWGECEQEVRQFPKARYKKFMTEKEALDFVSEGSGPSLSSNSPSKRTTTSHHSNTYKSEPTFGDFHAAQSKKHSLNLVSIPDFNSSDVRLLSLQEAKSMLGIAHQNIGKLTSLSVLLQSHIDSLDASESGGQRSNMNDTSQNNYGKMAVQNRGAKRKNRATVLLNEVPKRHKYTDAGKNGNTCVVYTDGCCHSNGKNGAKAGIGVYWGPNDPMNVAERLEGRPTNNRAEIHAAVKAIEQAKSHGYGYIQLHTDSQFLINAVTKWIKGWKRNGWILTTGQPVVNREDFEKLDQQMNGIKVEWVHVPGHQGVPGNEAADQLANEGANKPLLS